MYIRGGCVSRTKWRQAYKLRTGAVMKLFVESNENRGSSDWPTDKTTHVFSVFPVSVTTYTFLYEWTVAPCTCFGGLPDWYNRSWCVMDKPHQRWKFTRIRQDGDTRTNVCPPRWSCLCLHGKMHGWPWKGCDRDGRPRKTRRSCAGGTHAPSSDWRPAVAAMDTSMSTW